MKKEKNFIQDARQIISATCLLCLLFASLVFMGCSEEPDSGISDNNSVSAPVNDLGAMSPKEALEYMKKTENLIIVDVATRSWYAKEHFEGAINIPIENISQDEAKKLYLDIPTERPVILHCRLGMVVPGAYRTLKKLRPDIPEISYIDGTPLFNEYNTWKEEQNNKQDTEDDGVSVEKFLGDLTPSEALEYMKNTPNIYIIDVREPEWYKGYTQFVGNVNIPRSTLPERYREIPSDRPVILNCGAGVQAPLAYEFLKEKNIDVLQLSYIAGTPLFRAYNEWVKK